jgi:transmembrane 9 superfamily protein 2/4
MMGDVGIPALLLSLLLLAVSIQSSSLYEPRQCQCFYLPGMAPVTYCETPSEGTACKSKIQLFVNRLNSEEQVIPYEYDHFDFCQAAEDSGPAENLGQVVFGERIRPSAYQINFNEPEKCKVLCNKKYDLSNTDDQKKLTLLKKGMSMNYQHHWIVDNMPVTWCYPVENGQQYCSSGFPMGCYVDKGGNPKDACVISAITPSPTPTTSSTMSTSPSVTTTEEARIGASISTRWPVVGSSR